MDSAAEPRPLFQRRIWWVVLLLLIAGAYFGSYYRYSLNLRDESGTVTLLGQRVANGEVPFRDVVLGYNVGWFFPIAGLFKIIGVNFIALRVYFFALSTLAAVLGFLTVERAARHGGLRWWAIGLGMLAGVTLILTPGMTFKNYNPLAAVANSWCLLNFVLAMDGRTARRRAFIGGLVLGATWLVRIDIGTFFTVIWLGVIFSLLFERRWHGRGTIAIASAGLLLLGILLPHAPVVADAMRRDYIHELAASYPNEWVRLGQSLNKVLGKSKSAPAPSPAAAPAKPAAGSGETAAPAPAAPAAPATNTDTLPRPKWSSDAKTNRTILLMYLPILTLGVLACWSIVAWFRAVGRGSGTQGPMAALVLTGGALTMFPQYFFWRPDAPHLSEFGPGYWTAAIGAMALLGAWGQSWKTPSRWLVVLLTVNLGLWFYNMLQDRWCGTIAAMQNRKTLLEGKNGVRVFEQAKTVAWMKQVQDIVAQKSTEKDYLVAYPYHPAFNVITNRPTCEPDVYVDNVKGAVWMAKALDRLKEKKPKIIIISGWKINGTSVSQFKNWAKPVYDYVRASYESAGTFGDLKDGVLNEEDAYEVFVRRPDVPASQSP